jgi:hypothetical protein
MPPFMSRNRAVRDQIIAFLATPAGRVAALLLTGDLLFFAVRLVQVPTQFFDGPNFWLDTDGGYPEVYQYAKFAFMAGVCTILAARSTQRFLVWSAVFLFLLVDDMATVHELAGERLGEVLDLERVPVLAGSAAGELVFMAAAGLTALVVVASLALTGSRRFRLISADLVLLVGVVALFGIALDGLHAAVDPDDDQLVSYFFEFAEDGGEMIATSILAAYVYHAGLGDRSVDRYLHRRLVPVGRPSLR